MPARQDARNHLEDLTWEARPGAIPTASPEKVRDTLHEELALIAELDYARYFLTVHDIVRFAQLRASSARAAARPRTPPSATASASPMSIRPRSTSCSSASSREERKEPPDIDVDFEHERREEVIQYIYERYGRDRAGLAATVIHYRGAPRVREVGKALGLSEDTVAALATTVWGGWAGPARGTCPPGRARSVRPAAPRVLELTQELIGFPAISPSMSAASCSRAGPCPSRAHRQRRHGGPHLHRMGQGRYRHLGLKVDVLGLGMLTCIRKGFALLKEHTARRYRLGTVPRDDPGRLRHAVQGGLDRRVPGREPGADEHAAAAQAPHLLRSRHRGRDRPPGPDPGRHGASLFAPPLRRRAVEFPSPHPDHGPADELNQVLGKTMGVPLFQEQAMRLAMVAANSRPEANELRRAMATFRRRGTIDRLHEKMVSRMTASAAIRQSSPSAASTRSRASANTASPRATPRASPISSMSRPGSNAITRLPFAAALLNSQPMGFYAPAQIVRCARRPWRRGA